MNFERRSILKFFRKAAQLPGVEQGTAALAKMDPKRRNVLKLFMFGGGAFVLGKMLGPSINLFGGSYSVGKEHFFDNFRVVERNGELAFYDRLGNEILVIEND